MSNLQGVEGLSVEHVQDQVRQGARFIVYGYCLSFLVITLRRSSDIQFVRAGESPALKGLKYTLLSLFLGWWGFPWGFIYTPMVVLQNLAGGKDVTVEVMNMLGGGMPSPALPAVQVK